MKKIYLIFAVLLFVGCQNHYKSEENNSVKTTQKEEYHPVQVPSYQIYDNEVFNTTRKASQKEYLIYTDTVWKKDAFDTVLIKEYVRNKNNRFFKDQHKNRFFTAYLYPNKKEAKLKGMWLAMISVNLKTEALNTSYSDIAMDRFKPSK